VACTKCEDTFDSQGKKEKVCKKCNAKRSAVSRIFGKWPPAFFAKLTPEAQTDFWKGDSGTGEQQMLTDLVKRVTSQRVNCRAELQKGKYLPLGAYKVMGFDTEEIVKNCTDTEEHEVLGLTYKVTIHEASWGEIEKDVEQEILDVKQKRGRQLEDDEGPNKKKRKSRKKSSSSSSSGSSTGSGSKSESEMTPEELKMQAYQLRRRYLMAVSTASAIILGEHI